VFIQSHRGDHEYVDRFGSSAAHLEPMRRDPRFISLMHDLGLLDFWRRSGRWPDFCETEPVVPALQ
jgi:hypothetical protein